MSEAEKKRRFAYKQNRRKWIIIQIIAISVVLAIAVGCFATYYKLNKKDYINYSETGNVDYKVHLKDNDFYDEEWQEKDQAYIGSLIDKVDADFAYEFGVETDSVDFDYKYGIEAKLLVIDKSSGKAVYSPVYVLVPEATGTVKDANGIRFEDSVTLDYAFYNDIAESFIETYSLRNHESKLVVSMNVALVGAGEAFADNVENQYSFSVSIPLATHTVDMRQSASVPVSENKILARASTLNKNVFKIIAIIATVLDVLAFGGFIAFVYLTRNEDINYTIKLKKLVSSYRSYIQQLENDFDTEGYQILSIKTFNEMLGIRDTIQSPILMCENEDKTMTRFFIPTSTNLVYVYELKVDNYDELYSSEEIATEIDDEDVKVTLDAEKIDTADNCEEQDVSAENSDVVENTENAEVAEDAPEAQEESLADGEGADKE